MFKFYTNLYENHQSSAVTTLVLTPQVPDPLLSLIYPFSTQVVPHEFLISQKSLPPEVP